MSGHFLYHSIGTFPGKEDALRDELARFAAFWSREDDAQWPTALALRQDFIGRWRALIDAPLGTMTTAENVTAGLYSVIGALPERHLRGRRVLVAETASQVCISCWPNWRIASASRSTRSGCDPARPMCATRTLSRAGRTMSAWLCSPG